MIQRKRNTPRRGGNFTPLEIQPVWEKGRVDPNNDPNVFRKDSCGMFMRRDAYGTTTKYGWEIDHIIPVSRGGSDDLSNIQPLHWENNRGKGDDCPKWYCTVP